MIDLGRGDGDECCPPEVLAAWPNCATPDCGNKTCVWSPLPTICYPCGVARLGKSAMDEVYEVTHL